MTGRDGVAAGVALVFAVVLGWLSWSLSSVESELAALRDEVRAERPTADPSSAKPPPVPEIRRHVAPEPGEIPEPLLPGELRVVVDEALERQTLERAEADADRWIEASRRKVEETVEAMVDDGLIADGEGGQVIELLMAERLEGAQLKRDVVAGDLSESDAVDEWKAQRMEYAEALVALVGQERAAEIRAGLGGK